MNEIKNVFDKIKASEELKEKTYRAIRNKKNYKKLFVSLSLAFASILMLFMISSINDKPLLQPTTLSNEKTNIPRTNEVDMEKEFSDEEIFSADDAVGSLELKKEKNNDKNNNILYIIISGISGTVIVVSIIYFIVKIRA